MRYTAGALSSALPKLEASLHELPIFPLPEMVFFPGVQLPLHVFEPRYRKMIHDCLEANGAIAIAQLLPGEGPSGLPRLAKIVGGGVISEHRLLADGRSNILVEGLARLELDELPFVAPYRRARARVVEDEPIEVRGADHAALVSAATGFAREVRRHDKSFSLKLPTHLDARTLADLCAFQLVVDVAVRQRILEERRPDLRVRMVVEELMIQASALSKPGPEGKLSN